MFGSNEEFASDVRDWGIDTRSMERSVVDEALPSCGAFIRHEHDASSRMAAADRLAELVHHLGDVPLQRARRAVQHSDKTCAQYDPLSIVAAALVQLRRDSQRCLGLV